MVYGTFGVWWVADILARLRKSDTDGLTGGNPQSAKAAGDAPGQAYTAAMSGWKRDIGRRLDALIVRNVPNVRKAVRGNSPCQASRARAGSLGSTYSPLGPPASLPSCSNSYEFGSPPM